jgi:hypothetical protein
MEINEFGGGGIKQQLKRFMLAEARLSLSFWLLLFRCKLELIYNST